MKLQVTLVLIGMLLFEALQISAAMTCYSCEGATCTPTTEACLADKDRCFTITVDSNGRKTTVKGCTTKNECDKLGSVTNCCDKDLCNRDGIANRAATDTNNGTATSNNNGTATSNNNGTATSNNNGTATSNNNGTATSNNNGTATSNNNGTATTNHNGTATSNNNGTATSNNNGTATSNNNGNGANSEASNYAEDVKLMILGPLLFSILFI